MNNEFKKITHDNVTRYVLESDGGTTSSGSIASDSSAGFKKGLLLTPEGNKKTNPPKTRNPVAKNASAAIGGGAAGAHKDKKKAAKQGQEKHKKPYMEALQARLDQLKSNVAEGFNGEYDDEAGMAQSNLITTARAVMGLLKTIKDRDNLPEWGQEKIAKAEMMLVSVWDYLQSQKAMGNDPQQGVAEGLGDSGFNAMMGKITDPAARESLLPVEIQKVVQFLKGSIESLIEVLKSDPDFQPNDVRNSTDLRDMRKNLKSVMVDSDPKNVANAIFNYETEWRETMNEWAEEALGIELFTKLQNLYYGEYGEGVAEGNFNEIKKGAKDSNGFTKCWPGKHAVGTKKGKNSGQVRNCKPNESADSYFESLTNKLAEKLDPNAPVDDWVQDFAQANPEKYHQFRQNNRPGTRKSEKKIERMAQAASYAAKTGK